MTDTADSTTDAALDFVTKATALSGFTSAVGVKVVAVRSGEVEMAIAAHPGVMQFGGHFHGGIIAGLADHAAGAVVSVGLPPERIGVTVDLNVNFLHPAAGERLVAIAKTVRVGGAIGVAQVEVHSDTGGELTLCAIATVTLRSVPRPHGMSDT